MAELKTNTKKRDYRVVVQMKGVTITTVAVTAEGVRDALKKAYEKVSGWQQVAPDDL